MKNNMTEEERAEYSRNYSATHHISDIKGVPDTSHFAILCDEQYHQHDYYDKNGGSYASPMLRYIVFDDERALNAWILDSSNATKKYKVVRVNPVEVKVHTTVTIKE